MAPELAALAEALGSERARAAAPDPAGLIDQQIAKFPLPAKLPEEGGLPMTKKGDSPAAGPVNRRAFLGAAAIGTSATLALGGSDIAFAASPQVDFPDKPGTFGGGPARAPSTAPRSIFTTARSKASSRPISTAPGFASAPIRNIPSPRSIPATSRSMAKAMSRRFASRMATSTTRPMLSRRPSAGRRSTMRRAAHCSACTAIP